MRRRSCASPYLAWKDHEAEGHVRSALPHGHSDRRPPSCCAVSASTSPSAIAPTYIPTVPVRPSNRKAVAAWASVESLAWMLYGTSNSNSTTPFLILHLRLAIRPPSSIARRESPPWGIDLDTDTALLTEAEVESSFDNMDEGIGPDLRAKQRWAWRCGTQKGWMVWGLYCTLVASTGK